MLRTRVLTALCLAGVFFAVLFYAGVWATVGLFFVLTMVGAWEWSQFLGAVSRIRRVAYAGVIVVICGLGGLLAQSTAALLAIMVVAAIGWLGAAWFLCRAKPKVTPKIAAFAGPLVLVPCWLGLSALVLSPNQQAGRGLLLTLLGLVVVADIGAYFSGRAFGRRKLAPTISPGKTWEGVAGGTVLGMLLMGLLADWAGVPVLAAMLAGLVVVWMSVVGDLTESLFKRSVGLKDSGRIFPGHGGVLDRIDSISAATPFFVLGLWLCGLLQ